MSRAGTRVQGRLVGHAYSSRDVFTYFVTGNWGRKGVQKRRQGATKRRSTFIKVIKKFAMRISCCLRLLQQSIWNLICTFESDTFIFKIFEIKHHTRETEQEVWVLFNTRVHQSSLNFCNQKKTSKILQSIS